MGGLTNSGRKNKKVIDSGISGNRPTGVAIGYDYFDTTLGKPIWWDGTVWKDAAGTTVV